MDLVLFVRRPQCRPQPPFANLRRAARLGAACADVATACELLREQHKDAPWLAQVNDMEELLNEADAIEFPGMY